MDAIEPHGHVCAVAADSLHHFSKRLREEIHVIAGMGVEGDAHFGAAVQHRSRVAADPSQPNLRQVHLLHAELHEELQAKGFDVSPGVMGENITSTGVGLLDLPTGSLLRIGHDALLCITGLRNPCKQLDDYQPGLLAAVLGRDDEGRVQRKAGVMAVVVESGVIRPNDPIRVTLPPKPHHRLERV